MSGQILQKVILHPEVKRIQRKVPYKKPEVEKLLENLTLMGPQQGHLILPEYPFTVRKFRDEACGWSSLLTTSKMS